MKRFKLSCRLALSMCVMFLSGASESAMPTLNHSKTVTPDKHEIAASKIETPPPKIDEPTAFETKVLEALRSIADQQNTANEQSEASQKSWYSPGVLVQIVLILVGLLYTGFACMQWRAIHRQADIAESSIAQLERPWIIVTDVKWTLKDSDDMYDFRGVINWSAKNVGRSPAFLTKLAVGAKVVPYPVSVQQPTYPESEPFDNYILPQTGMHSSQLNVCPDGKEMQRIFDEKACLIFFGVADYRDSIGKAHRTRFSCYWYGSPTRYEPVGPPSHMEYT